MIKENVAVRTAIIPVAGLGTRVLPATKSIPKEMMTLVDRPIIQYIVDEAIKAGITRIILITRAGKESIENHFSPNFELEQLLRSKSKKAQLEAITNIIPPEIQLLSVRQEEALGLGHAVHCASKLCVNEPFAVLLPDMILTSHAQISDLSDMIKNYEQTGLGQILVEQVSEQSMDQFGIVECRPQTPESLPPIAGNISRMIEKPAPSETKSRSGIVGRYVLPFRVMELLQNTAPGKGGEIQLTDALESLLLEQDLQAHPMLSQSFDCGSTLGFLQANIHLGLTDTRFEKDLQQTIDNALSHK